ncbi:hypothetical protein [Rhizobium sp. AAP43]|uniref:hypothetical protein n=1 Tax=Rhizobium sp. AAP43 TaxID=1523420 RepID=UPI0006B8F4DE|nr:hypothetical protein [Rhizobium sp. AAP43]KPF47261.1 hypothetical protein IP76_00370 [Rhizobium sp. AAP43]
MTTEKRKAIARELLSYFPETIKDRLILDRGFRGRNGIRTVAKINFAGVDGSFPRNELMRAVSRVFHPGSTPETVADEVGDVWLLAFDAEAGEPTLTKGEQRISLGSLWYVAADDATRCSRLEQMFNENRAVGADLDRWRELLTAGPIDLEDIETFHQDFERTPTQIVLGIRAGMAEGSSKQDSLTPRGLNFYERLVGARGDAATMTAFAEVSAKSHVKELLAWNAEEGLRQALLAGSQASLVPSLPEGFDLAILERVTAWAADRGDRISQTAAFELGLRHLKESPFLMPYLVSIAEQIRDDDPEDPNGRLLLLSNLFVFVDGSIAQLGYLRDVPPYWRRLASIAQASLIEREFVRGGISPGNSTNWMNNGRGTPFYLQNSIDGRLEPRWLPDFATPQQWKQELAGRLVGAADLHAHAIQGTPLEPLVRSSDAGSLRSQLEFPFAHLPGPIEGGLDRMVEAPPEFEALARHSVAVDATDPEAFNALVNTCLVFGTLPELAQKAAEGIKAAKYRIRDNARTGQNFGMLSGLALVAAVTRSQDLAREVRVLNRVALRRAGSDLDMVQSFRIGIIAANAFSDLNEWRQFVGDWITELAFSDMDRATAIQLHGLVEVLCDLEPALWATLSRADAALTSFVNSVQSA